MIRNHEMFKRVIYAKLLQLNSEQSILFHRYCKLVSNHCNNLDRINQVEEIQCIWSRAIEDKHLSDCLSLIDYFVSLEDFEIDKDRDAYLEEYLEEVVKNSIVDSGREYTLKSALAERNSGSSEKLQSIQVGESGEGFHTKKVLEIAVVDLDDYQGELPQIKTPDQNMDMIIDMISLRIKELKNIASELVPEAVIKIY